MFESNYNQWKIHISITIDKILILVERAKVGKRQTRKKGGRPSGSSRDTGATSTLPTLSTQVGLRFTQPLVWDHVSLS